ncbi:ImmA/IrrE family metallo-endopeptidase [Corynebacterium sp. H113]|uniref:ImmA/IrrE family metallo-endopeptidase n=1 Tax=Corynebacterium sp. H113 TaxID=3133419 RepID=UPI0030AA319D
MTTDELHELAEQIGVTVTTHDEGPKGWYSHHLRTISLHTSLRAANYRCTLAHEIAHAIAGDTHTGLAHFDARAERAANMTAAQMLITQHDYEQAERIHGPHLGAIARELGVTKELLDVWKQTYERQKQ